MQNTRTEMEMWDHRPLPRHRRNNPSFSSSLLDAIYRSIDEESDSAGVLNGGAPDSAARRPRAVPVCESPVTPLNYPSYYHSSSSSSSADSARTARRPRPRPKPARTGPVLTRSDRIRSDPPPPNPSPTNNPISIKMKLRELKKSTSPSSPGAKLAGFLNALFMPSNHKKAKISAAESPSPTSATASSYSRSCLSKTPSTHRSTGSSGTKRSVRFSPVGVIVGEDCRPCGEKFLFDGEATAAAERRRRVVEELMKGFEMEAESGDESDDGSEDLFELENLAGINGAGGTGRGFRDELPVYGTTDLGINCAIARGLVV